MTEKDYNPKQKEKKAIEKQSKKVETLKEPKSPIKEKQKENLKIEDKKKVEEDKGKPEIKAKGKKEQPKKPKKTEAVVNSFNLPISTKNSAAICRFIKNKKIENAIADLEQVLTYKKAIPMKGEIPHRKGKGMMSGRYPKKATEYFIKLLKNLSANANANEFVEPIIMEAVANIGSRPFGKFGRVRKKRTHVRIIAKEKRLASKKNKK